MAKFGDFLPLVGSGIDYLLGQRSAKKAAARAGKVAYDENMQGVLGRVEAAKAAGLHPLAVLGGSFGGSGGGAAVGSDFTGAFESMGRDRLAREQFREESKQRQADRDARAAEVRGQAELNTANINRLNNESAWLQEQIRSSQAEDARRAAASNIPLVVPSARSGASGPKVPEMYVPVRDRFGKIQYIPNPDIYDLELPSLVGAGTLVQPEVQTGGSRMLEDVENSSIRWKGWKGVKDSFDRWLFQKRYPNIE